MDKVGHYVIQSIIIIEMGGGILCNALVSVN